MNDKNTRPFGLFSVQGPKLRLAVKTAYIVNTNRVYKQYI